MADLTLYRGTTELWEKAVIEASLPDTSLIAGGYMVKSQSLIPKYEEKIRAKIAQAPCSMLRSGKEIVVGVMPPPLSTMSAIEINAEIVKRVGVETALGTPNYYSHFVPCGTNPGISQHFGHGAHYRFHVQGEIYGKSMTEIQRYVAERATLPGYIYPLFEGGHNEVLAYTGTLITSVFFMYGENVGYSVMNSLD